MTFTLEMPRPDAAFRTGDVSLTGDRPTGALHLGHLAGSLAARLVAQDVCDQVVLVADLQALTDHVHDTAKVRASVAEVVKDYVAVGLDPTRTTFALQSAVPELAELTSFCSMVVGTGRALRNPTIREEARTKGLEDAMPLAFATYGVSQAADILGFGATVVPVGTDQLPMIDLAREIARTLARKGVEVPVPRAVYGSVGRLPGLDGRKASKSLGNAIPLRGAAGDLPAAVKGMMSDPARMSPSDPGNPDVAVTFAHLRAFDTDRKGLSDLEMAYRAGGVRDSDVKDRTLCVLERLLRPIRERAVPSDDEAIAMLREGSRRARDRAAATLRSVRKAFGVFEP